MAENDNEEMPELNQKWFDKRFQAIRGSNVRQAEVELRCLIREIHVAVRFRDVKEARRRLDAEREPASVRVKQGAPGHRWVRASAECSSAREQSRARPRTTTSASLRASCSCDASSRCFVAAWW